MIRPLKTAVASLLLAAVASVAAVGCGVKKPFEGRNDPYPPGQVHFASQMLQDSTARGVPSASRDEAGNILYVTVPLRNTTNQQLYIDYRVTFLDRNGQQLNQTGWFTRTLTPNVPDTITVNSLGPRATDFQVDIRQAK